MSMICLRGYMVEQTDNPFEKVLEKAAVKWEEERVMRDG